MSVRRVLSCILTLLLLAKLPSGRADELPAGNAAEPPEPRARLAEELHLTVGLKTWISSWTSWAETQTVFNQVTYQTIAPLSSDTRVALIPLVSLRYGRWLVSTSYTASTEYQLAAAQPFSNLRNVTASRSEVDGTVGYYLVPGLAALVGYKRLDREFGSDLRWSGPIVGLSSSAPLGSFGLSAYGTVFYGPFQLSLPADAPDASGRTTFEASYVLIEAGINYSFEKHYVVTLGYRSQRVKTAGYSLSAITSAGSSPYATSDLTDTTQGPTLGLAATF